MVHWNCLKYHLKCILVSLCPSGRLSVRPSVQYAGNGDWIFIFTCACFAISGCWFFLLYRQWLSWHIDIQWLSMGIMVIFHLWHYFSLFINLHIDSVVGSSQSKNCSCRYHFILVWFPRIMQTVSTLSCFILLWYSMLQGVLTCTVAIIELICWTMLMA